MTPGCRHDVERTWTEKVDVQKDGLEAWPETLVEAEQGWRLKVTRGTKSRKNPCL